MWTHLALALAMVLHCSFSYESKRWEMISTAGYMESTHLMALFVAKVINKSAVLERFLARCEHDMHSPYWSSAYMSPKAITWFLFSPVRGGP